MELTFNKLLSGRDGEEQYQGRRRCPIPLGESMTRQARRRPGTSTSPWIRTCSGTRSVSCAAVERTPGSESGSIIVQDTRTGELLTVADYPT